MDVATAITLVGMGLSLSCISLVLVIKFVRPASKEANDLAALMMSYHRSGQNAQVLSDETMKQHEADTEARYAAKDVKSKLDDVDRLWSNGMGPSETSEIVEVGGNGRL